MRRPLLNADGVVVNVIALTDGAPWTPPAGLALGVPGGEIGDTWDGANYVRPSGPEPPPPTEEDYAAAVQAHVDAAARSRGYRDGFALAGYATSTMPAWADEAAAFIAWRDAVWGYAYGELEKVEAQARAQPSIAELVAELPPIAWPA
jgi:hypothetical protein